MCSIRVRSGVTQPPWVLLLLLLILLFQVSSDQVQLLFSIFSAQSQCCFNCFWHWHRWLGAWSLASSVGQFHIQHFLSSMVLPWGGTVCCFHSSGLLNFFNVAERKFCDPQSPHRWKVCPTSHWSDVVVQRPAGYWTDVSGCHAMLLKFEPTSRHLVVSWSRDCQRY